MALRAAGGRVPGALRAAPTHLRTLVVLLLAVTALGTTGCSRLERVCSSDAYPVRTVDPSDDGLDCAPDGEEPPAGYERFPAGQEPEYVDDLYPQ